MAQNKRSIPQLRKRLREIAEETGNDELNVIADELQRNPAAKRAPRKSTPFTAEMAEEVREFAQAHPDAHNQEIADHFGVNPGRVSEALHNKR
jgi:hypothetical protein